jgi:hypothetical protein
MPTLTPVPTLPPATETSLPTATELPPEPSETPEPAAVGYAASAYSGQRLFLNQGATMGTYTAEIGKTAPNNYLLIANQGQPLFIALTSDFGDVTMAITNTVNGQPILPASGKRDNWKGVLPDSGDYLVQIFGSGRKENFTLQYNFPARPYIPAGDRAVLNGTASEFPVSYVVTLVKGQRLDVYLESPNSAVYVTIVGFDDGRYLVHPDERANSFKDRVSVAQDYIINVVPRGTDPIPYTLLVSVH